MCIITGKWSVSVLSKGSYFPKKCPYFSLTRTKFFIPYKKVRISRTVPTMLLYPIDARKDNNKAYGVINREHNINICI